jgi:hypothetical protein
VARGLLPIIFQKSKEDSTMNLPVTVSAISVTGAGVLIPLLWYLLGRPFRIASTSQELLDLFEDDTTGAPKSNN